MSLAPSRSSNLSSGEVDIRRCTVGDEAALALVGQSSFLEAFAGALNGADIIAHCTNQHAAEKYRRWLSDSQSCVWLAEAKPGAAPVGYLVLTKPDLPLTDISADDLEIKRVYLLHRFQGQGMGKRLMDEARRFAVAAGARRLLLGVYSNNHHALSFYAALGYKPAGQRSFQVGNHTYHDLILELVLGRS